MSAHDIKRVVPPARDVLHVACGEAEGLGLPRRDVAADGAVGVGLEEMRVGRAVGEDAVDVDIHHVGSAHVDVVDVLAVVVEVGGEL